MEVLEYHKQIVMDDSDWSSGDQNAHRNASGKGQIQEVSFGKKNSIGSWSIGHVWCSQAQYVSMLYPCLETLWETEIRQ